MVRWVYRGDQKGCRAYDISSERVSLINTNMLGIWEKRMVVEEKISALMVVPRDLVKHILAKMGAISKSEGVHYLPNTHHVWGIILGAMGYRNKNVLSFRESVVYLGMYHYRKKQRWAIVKMNIRRRNRERLLSFTARCYLRFLEWGNWDQIPMRK